MSSQVQVSWLGAPISACLVVRIDFWNDACEFTSSKQRQSSEWKLLFAVLVYTGAGNFVRRHDLATRNSAF